MRNFRGKSKGLTLIELLITFFVISVILTASTKAFFQFFKANVRVNQRAVKTALATARLEEWKSIRGENFEPGVSFPIYTPSVNSSTGVISFSRTVVTVPAVTQLEVDCTSNTALTTAPGYGYSLLQGNYSNPGWGSTSNCWVDPVSRAVGDTTPGNIKFAIDCPAGVTGTLGMVLTDYGTLARSERVVVNNLVKGTYNLSSTGTTISLNLDSLDTGTGHVTIELEQTDVINTTNIDLDTMYSTSASWTRYPSSISRSNITTPFTPLPYTETDTKALTVAGPGSAGQYLRRAIDTSTGTVGDTISVWARLDTNQKCWLTTPGGSSNVITSAVTGWQKISRVTTMASEISSSTQVTINFDGLTTPNSSDRFIVNQLQLEKVKPINPNAVLTSFSLKSLIGFKDPDTTSGSPVTTASHPGYIITSTLLPTDTTVGQAVGWTVTVSVSKENDEYEPVVISNTINR